MRILHVVHQYIPEKVGGTELYTQTMGVSQTAEGHEVAIFYPSIEHQTLEIEVQNGLRIYHVPRGARSANQVFKDTVWGNQQLTAAFQEVVTAEQPDIVHIEHLMGLPATLPNYLVKVNIPYVVTLHDYWYGCANGQLFTNYDQSNCLGPQLFLNCGRCAVARAGIQQTKLLAAPVAPLLAWRQHKLRRVLREASSVITPTEFVQEMYAQMGFDLSNFVLIRHGIEVPIDKIEAAKAQAAAHERPSAPLNLLYIGGISPQKGLHTLIQAFNQLPEDAQLLIYGDLHVFPDYVADLEALIDHDGIRLCGRLAHEQIWAAIAAADLVAMPTHWYEASPLTIDEVFAVGVPLIASKLGAQTEKIIDGQNGILVPPADPAAWQAALQDVYDHPAKLAQLRQGIQPVRTVAEHLQDVMTLYHQVLSGG